MATLIDALPSRFSGLASSLPSTDRASLVGLSNSEIRACSAAKADEYRKFALAFLCIYNAVAPIHCLPFEVLSTIFKMSWTNRKSFQIGHVCRQWRSVLLNTPVFWANAVEGEPFRVQDPSNGYLGAMLERSTPQTITPSFRYFNEHMSPCLALHANRFVSLEVILGDHTELARLWSCLNAGMRSLKNLSIALFNDPWWALGTPNPDEILRLSPAALPRLTYVTAPGSFLQYVAHPSLRHISLWNSEVEHVYDHRLRSDEHLRNALAVCAPNLETLALRNVSPPRGYEDAPLPLPALRNFVIEDDARPCAVMLSRLILPDTSGAATYIEVSAANCTSLCAAVPPSAPAVQSALSATDSVGILSDPRSKSNTVAVHCSASKTRSPLLTISLRAPESDPEPQPDINMNTNPVLAPDDLVRFFRHKPGGPLVAVLLGELDSGDVPAVDLRAFPGVCGIVACGPSMGVHVLHELARTELLPTDTSGESDDDDDDDDGADHDNLEEGHPGPPRGEVRVRAICPELELLNLEFELYYNYGQLRWGDGSPGQVPGEPALPALAQMGFGAHAGGADVDAHFRSLCAQLERVLPLRAEMGTKLTRLGLGCPDRRWQVLAGSEGEAATNSDTNTAELELEPWGPIVERLEKLVDGPVVFRG